MTSYQDVLQYWFGTTDAIRDGNFPPEKYRIWFAGGEQVDREIRERFAELVIQARNAELEDWLQSADSRLALILLLDQFTRNIYRGTDQAFAADHLALKYALQAIECGHDQELAPIARAFFYMPLEHDESLEHQDRCVELFESLTHQAPDAHVELFQGFLDYAVQHRDIIARFGRFPHRNAILGRESTAEELAYLEATDVHFGQKASS
ncbi:DUF924 domain-containing protein [Lujinxingia litoralis]|uniref:DUF924 domain-containing protein n=1 Tax=Lujinxingia litoralis TaxID=2211119 RepID=A0A328C743_9DELT|nr:DUF924 family protein [Lujinxingia litoralis]RAL22872.1 DUF924 domain-containing protein [Lujinxingia litoralis]